MYLDIHFLIYKCIDILLFPLEISFIECKQATSDNPSWWLGNATWLHTNHIVVLIQHLQVQAEYRPDSQFIFTPMYNYRLKTVC